MRPKGWSVKASAKLSKSLRLSKESYRRKLAENFGYILLFCTSFKLFRPDRWQYLRVKVKPMEIWMNMKIKVLHQCVINSPKKSWFQKVCIKSSGPKKYWCILSKWTPSNFCWKNTVKICTIRSRTPSTPWRIANCCPLE